MTPESVENTRTALYVLGFVPMAGFTLALVRWLLGKLETTISEVVAGIGRVETSVNEHRTDIRLLKASFDRFEAENKLAHGLLWEAHRELQTRVHVLELQAAKAEGRGRE